MAQGRPSRPPPGVSLAVARTGFAAVAMRANPAARMATLAAHRGPYEPWPAMAAGTVAAPVPKHVPDERRGFDDRGTGFSAHAQRSTPYTPPSVATTGSFRATEPPFSRPGGTWYTVGAVLGLGLDHRVKFQLDRRFAFRSAGCN